MPNWTPLLFLFCASSTLCEYVNEHFSTALMSSGQQLIAAERKLTFSLTYNAMVCLDGEAASAHSPKSPKRQDRGDPFILNGNVPTTVNTNPNTYFSMCDDRIGLPPQRGPVHSRIRTYVECQGVAPLWSPS